MAEGRIVGAASYEALEGAFAEELRGVVRRAASATWVLVPTNLLALHLRRRAARRLGGIMGVEFLTLKDAAARMALPSLAGRGQRPMPAGAVEVVLQRLLEGVPDDAYLSAFRRFANGAPALARAIGLLEDCLWTPGALAQAAPSTRGHDLSAPRRLRELADLWRGLRSWKQERGLFEDGDLVRQAGQGGGEPAERPGALFLYGFYDFTPSQHALVARVISLADRCTAYLLWQEDEQGGAAPGFEYAAPTVEWLVGALAAEGAECLAQPAGGSDLARLVAGVFEEQPLAPAGEERDALQTADAFDGSVRVVSCPGERAEAEEVVREVLRVAQGAAAGASVGVLLRGTEDAGLLAEELDRAGLRCYMREGLPLAETSAGRVALALLDLAAGEQERNAVVDFLAMAEVRWPEGLSPTALDRVAREAGIIRGRAQWAGRLLSRAEQLRRQAARSEDEAESGSCGRDAALCLAAAGFLAEFFEEVHLLASAATWADVASRLRRLVDRYAPGEPAEKAPVLEAADDLGRLDVTGTRPQVERVRWLLSRHLGARSLKRGRFGHVGVTASSIMAARGAAFDVVIVPGLVEKRFPRHVAQHSVLTELDREALGGAAGPLGCGELPLQKDRPLEERYLFRIALGSARRAVALTYPRLEEDSDRPRVPSRFVAAACSALAGVDVRAELLDEGLPAGLVHRVPLNRRGRAPAELELALDAFEYDDAVFCGPEVGRPRRAYMSEVSATFQRAARMDDVRWRRRDYGPYDGKVRADDLLEVLREKYGRFTTAVSPTRLETYAACPFRYFLTYVLGVEEVEAPSEEFQLPPIERGALVHDLLLELYASRLRGRRLGALSDDEIAEAVGAAGGMLDRLGRVHAENHPATWTAERERTRDELKALLLHERRGHADAAPELFEYEFGMGGPAPYELDIGEGRRVAFRGRIDRLDRLGGDGIEAVDYKTGKGSGLKKATFRGGRQLQLPVYLLAAAELLEARKGGALYLLVSGPKDVPQFTLPELAERMDEFRRAVRLIVEGIAAGNFFPLPAADADVRRACEQFCPYAVVCGAARGTLAEMKQTDPEAASLRELRGTA